MRAGFLFVDKPAGLTSHDVVARVRRAARMRRVGHAGTLDPFATGLLVLAVGNATRLLQFVQGEPKVYVTEIAFGSETDTDDVTGRVVRHAPLPDKASVDSAINALMGTIHQLPPAFSAKHVDGNRAYELARRGEQPQLRAAEITVHAFEILSQSADVITARITCSGGTYIRALARDLGRESKSAAHCRTLRRVSSGTAGVDTAIPLDAITPGSIADGAVALVNPLDSLIEMEHVALTADEQRMLSRGVVIPFQKQSAYARAAFLDANGEVLGIGERVAHGWQPRVVLDAVQTIPV
jgi:tRNA pseudouridine55 synthase